MYAAVQTARFKEFWNEAARNRDILEVIPGSVTAGGGGLVKKLPHEPHSHVSKPGSLLGHRCYASSLGGVLALELCGEQ